MKLSSGKSSSVLLLVALVAVLLFAVYYYVILPKQEEADRLASSVNSLESEISSLQDQISEADKVESTSNEFILRKKVPETRAINELLLNIEEIEYITNSRILGINFNNYDSLVSESDLAPKEEETTTEETNEENSTENEKEEVPTSTISIASLPTSLKMVTFELEVESPNNARLQKFIKEIESLDRIMHIDTISYSLPGEELEFEGTSEIVEATIQVTTFYFE